jgi:DNA replication and repair protein RecF
VLISIDIEHFRCIEEARLELDPRCTAILGENASGKTSLLEAIYFLAHGRSFRTAQRERLLQTGSPFFRIVGRVQAARGPLVAGIEYAQGKTRAHLAGQGVSGIADIAEVLPVQVIDPGVHRLIEEGSARRRRLMDWGVFHVKHEFLGHWRRYQRALQQRNTALRAAESGDVLSAWEPELKAAAQEIDRLRAEYLGGLKPHFEALSLRLLEEGATFLYRRGWPEDEDLSASLEASRERDRRLRTTTVGPHRADLTFLVGGVAARDRVSRGQQKMLAAAFILSQLAFRATHPVPPACLMLDDPAAELDVDNLGKLLSAVAEIPSQLVVTSVHQRGLNGIDVGRWFHVKRGQFAPML